VLDTLVELRPGLTSQTRYADASGADQPRWVRQPISSGSSWTRWRSRPSPDRGHAAGHAAGSRRGV